MIIIGKITYIIVKIYTTILLNIFLKKIRHKFNNTLKFKIFIENRENRKYSLEETLTFKIKFSSNSETMNKLFVTKILCILSSFH